MNGKLNTSYFILSLSDIRLLPINLLPVLHVDSDWSFIDFMNAASQRLDIVPAATRVFNANGKS